MSRILVIGDLNVDLVATGLAHMPELGREHLCSDLAVALGGSSANTACGLARLGHTVDMLACVGDDIFGRFLLQELRNARVGADRVAVHPLLRTGASLSLNHGNDRAFVTYVGTIDGLAPEDVPADVVAGYDHVHAGSYFLQKRRRARFSEPLREARRLKITTSIDVGCDPEGRWDVGDVLAWADVFLPNEVEASGIAHVADPEAALLTLAKRVPCVALKLGDTGSLGARSGHVARAEPPRVKCVDSTGAGDAFNAGFIHGFLGGQSLETCLRMGNMCGASCVAKSGALPGQPTLAELLEWFPGMN